MTYNDFLQSKRKRFRGDGFACDAALLPSDMFDWC